MKKLLKLLMAGVLLTSVSCVQDITEDLTVGVQGGAQEFTVGIDQSRVVLGDKDAMGKYPLYWSNGDKISINGIVSSSLKVAEGELISQANFTVTPGEDQVLEAPFKVLYPGNADGQVVFKALQSYTNGTFATGTTPMYGYSEESATLTLQNLAGAVKIGVKGEEGVVVTRILVESTDGKPLSGTFDIDHTTGVLTATDDVVTAAAVRSTDGVALSPDAVQYFYIALPAGEYAPLNITVVTAEHGTMRVAAKDMAGAESFSLGAGEIKSFNELTFSENAVVFEIFDVDGLFQFADMVKAGTLAKSYDKVVLAGDIYAASGAKPWETLDGFNGVFDGQDFKIYDLSVPLFGESAATISNVTLVAPRITVSERLRVGALVCDLTTKGPFTGTLTNCHAIVEEGVGEFIYDGKATDLPTEEGAPTKVYAGGLVGYAGSSSTIKNCSNALAVTIQGNFIGKVDVGGVVGYTGSSLTDVTNTGDVKYSGTNATSLRIGGLGGCVSKTVTNGNNGEANSAKASITVDGTFNFPTDGAFEFNVGGLLGRAGGNITTSANYGAVTVSSTLTVPNQSDWGAFGIGGLVGRGTVTYDTVTNAGNITVTSNFTAVSSYTKLHPAYVAGVFGYGTSANNKKLYNSGTINVSGNHEQAAGLYVSGIYCRGSNGDSYTFSECENTGAINVSATTISTVKVAGVVSYQIRGTQKDSFNDAPLSFTGKCKTLHIGGVATDDAAKVKFINCDNREKGVITVNGDVGTDYSYVGGICSFMEGAAEMTDCQNDAAINYTNTNTGTKYKAKCGGLVGYSSSKSLAVTNCVNNGNLNLNNALKYVGGCFAHSEAAVDISNWTNIKNTGHITWPNETSQVPYIGGVVGLISGSATGIIKDWHNSGNLHIATTATKVSSIRTFVGGLVGMSCVYTLSYCSNTGDVLAPYARRTSTTKPDLASCVGLFVGMRYYNTGADGLAETPKKFRIENCLINGTIKRYKTDKSGVDECEVDTLEEMYKYAFVEPGDMTTEEHNPANYFFNCYATGEFIPETPAQE